MRKILMSARHALLKFVRQLHLYLGAFTAPALLFFAVTGGLQTFGLHESHRGSDYRPPAWLATMAQLHKKQTMQVPVRRKRPPTMAVESGGGQATAAASMTPAPARPVSRARNPLPLKIFVGLVALALLLSTMTGVYMAYRYSRDKRLVSLALVAGVVVPVLLALF
jgi:hypothetical protein